MYPQNPFSRRLPLATMCVIAIVSAVHPASSCKAQWPADTETLGRGGAAGALSGHLSPLRPAQLPEWGSGLEIARTVPLGVGSLAASAVRAWHTRGRWSGGAGLDSQSFDRWSALRPYAAVSTKASNGPWALRLGGAFGVERETLGLLGKRTTPLIVAGARATVRERIHLAAYGINNRSAGRQGSRASLHVSIACETCSLHGHAAWTLHPEAGSLWSVGAEWMLSRWLSMGLGGQSVPLAVGISIRVQAPGNLSARVAALSHHNTAPTRAVSLRATRGSGAEKQ